MKRLSQILSLLKSPGYGGQTARRLLPLAVLIPIFLGMVYLQARNANLLGRFTGVVFFVCAIIGVFLSFVVFVSARIESLELDLVVERENFRSLFREVPEMVVMTKGPQHTFDFVSQAHVKALGFDATGMTVRQAQPESLEIYSHLDGVYQTGVTDHMHEIPITLGPKLRYFDLTYMARRDAHGQIDGIMILGSEVSGLVETRRNMAKSEAQYKKLANELAEAVRARDEFLSIASHELKTPLTTLKLQSQIFKRRQAKGNVTSLAPAEAAEMADFTEKQVTRITRLVDDMLDIARIRSGKLVLDPQPFDLSELTRETLDRLRPQFETAKAEFPRADLTPAMGRWDRGRLEQVLANLITNAIRYGGGKPIRVKVSHSGGIARLEVADQGMGVAPENREKIFDRFERAVNASEVSGLGLGLFITKQIVLAHGGRVWVEGELGQGSNFIVELPTTEPAHLVFQI